jgi:hypothetical protein
VLERPFLTDNRAVRRMVIGNVDLSATKKSLKREKQEMRKSAKFLRIGEITTDRNDNSIVVMQSAYIQLTILLTNTGVV